MEMLPLWIEFFEDLQQVRGRSQNTVMAYRRDLELFADYRLKEKSIAGFYEYMKLHKLSARSQARVVSSLRTYFKLRELKPPRVKVNLPKTLTLGEFEKLLLASVVEDEDRSRRNHLTLMLLFSLGCRVSELIALDLEDYHESDRWLKIVGKAQKERLVPVSDHLALLLADYIQKSRENLLKENSSTILVNDRGHRPSRVDIWRWLAAWSEKAGFDEPVGPHRFRHGCATALLENGADLRSIQALLGHSSIQTTQIYTNVTTQNMVKVVEQHHPLSQIKDLES